MERDILQLKLDEMTSEELMRFWHKTYYGGLHFSQALCPALLNGARPTGYCQVVRDLGNYASNRATSLNRELLPATRHEYQRIAERIYSQLPQWAKTRIR